MTPAPGGDVLDTGPEQGPGRVAAAWRRWGSGRRRWARLAAVAVVGAAAVLLALRTTGGDPTERPGPAVPDSSAGIVVLPTAPYDRLPGRTPIPAPTAAGGFLRGSLPPVGGPDEPAALRAAGLVLGRACYEPAAYTLTLEPEPDWRRVTALVFTLDRSGDPPRITLLLTWTGRTYDWTGPEVGLRVC